MADDIIADAGEQSQADAEQANAAGTADNGQPEEKSNDGKAPEQIDDILDLANETDAEGDGAEKPEKEQGDEKEDGEEPEGAPEKYESFTLPEGLEADADKAAKFEELARKNNLSQEAAQDFVDQAAQLVQDTADKFAAGQRQMWLDKLADWHKEIKADPDFTGDKLQPSLGMVVSAIDEFAASPEDAQALKDTVGISNHPAFLRMMRNIKASVSSDTAEGGGSGGSEPSSEELLRKRYPTMYPKK